MGPYQRCACEVHDRRGSVAGRRAALGSAGKALCRRGQPRSRSRGDIDAVVLRVQPGDEDRSLSVHRDAGPVGSLGDLDRRPGVTHLSRLPPCQVQLLIANEHHQRTTARDCRHARPTTPQPLRCTEAAARRPHRNGVSPDHVRVAERVDRRIRVLEHPLRNRLVRAPLRLRRRRPGATTSRPSAAAEDTPARLTHSAWHGSRDLAAG